MTSAASSKAVVPADSFDLFAEFATDETAELDGVWMPYKGRKFLIARSGNREYGKLLSKLYNKHQKTLEAKDKEADKKSDEIMAEVCAKTILKGWEGTMVVEKGGQPVHYSHENAKKALLIKDFRSFIMRLADDVESFKVVKEDDQEKNSESA
jgi:hypothetical protein